MAKEGSSSLTLFVSGLHDDKGRRMASDTPVTFLFPLQVFGEGLPNRFFERLGDLKEADLLITMGTSLQVSQRLTGSPKAAFQPR